MPQTRSRDGNEEDSRDVGPGQRRVVRTTRPTPRPRRRRGAMAARGLSGPRPSPPPCAALRSPAEPGGHRVPVRPRSQDARPRLARRWRRPRQRPVRRCRRNVMRRGTRSRMGGTGRSSRPHAMPVPKAAQPFRLAATATLTCRTDGRWSVGRQSPSSTRRRSAAPGWGAKDIAAARVSKSGEDAAEPPGAANSASRVGVAPPAQRNKRRPTASTAMHHMVFHRHPGMAGWISSPTRDPAPHARRRPAPRCTARGWRGGCPGRPRWSCGSARR